MENKEYCAFLDSDIKEEKTVDFVRRKIAAEEKIYDLADIYHSDNIERVSDDFIREAGIRNGEFDNVKECNYAIPSHWDIGKVYKRLIKAVAEHEKIGIIEALFKVYNSFLSTKIDDYNSSMYYENPAYLLECYLESRVI